VSMILPELIDAFGWRTGYRLTALGWLLLGTCAVWLLRGSDETAPAGESGAGKRDSPRLLGSQGLYLLIFVMLLLSAASGVQQQLPSVLGETAPDRVGGEMSVVPASLALGKIAQGILCGRVGPEKGGFLMVLCYIAGFALLGWGLVWPGLLLLAAGMGTVTTLMPIVTRAIFGGQEYASAWSILSAVSNLGALTAAPLFGLAYDLSGSYGGAMIVASIMLIPALAGLLAVFRSKR